MTNNEGETQITDDISSRANSTAARETPETLSVPFYIRGALHTLAVAYGITIPLLVNINMSTPGMELTIVLYLSAFGALALIFYLIADSKKLEELQRTLAKSSAKMLGTALISVLVTTAFSSDDAKFLPYFLITGIAGPTVIVSCYIVAVEYKKHRNKKEICETDSC